MAVVIGVVMYFFRGLFGGFFKRCAPHGGYLRTMSPLSRIDPENERDIALRG
jgi:hypothetical protein